MSTSDTVQTRSWLGNGVISHLYGPCLFLDIISNIANVLLCWPGLLHYFSHWFLCLKRISLNGHFIDLSVSVALKGLAMFLSVSSFLHYLVVVVVVVLTRLYKKGNTFVQYSNILTFAIENSMRKCSNLFNISNQFRQSPPSAAVFL